MRVQVPHKPRVMRHLRKIMEKLNKLRINRLIKDGRMIINHCKWNILHIKKNIDAIQKDLGVIFVRIEFND